MILCPDMELSGIKLLLDYFLNKIYMCLCQRKQFSIHAAEERCLRRNVFSEMIKRLCLQNNYLWMGKDANLESWQ